MGKTTTLDDIIATYKAAKAETHDEAKACRAIMTAHGLDADDAADVCWHIEAGKPAPHWVAPVASGHAEPQCEASKDWDRGLESRYDD